MLSKSLPKTPGPYTGLNGFLGACETASIPMVVRTSAPKQNVDFSLDGPGIRSLFHEVPGESAVTTGKPKPESYQQCAAAIELPIEQCVVFEEARSGIKAGKAASHQRDELEEDLVIDDIAQINLEQIHELFSTNK